MKMPLEQQAPDPDTGTGADTGAGTDADTGTVADPHFDFYIGERLAMGSTAIGGEASRVLTQGDGRAGPDREHARREPFSDDSVLKRKSRSTNAPAFHV